MSWPCGRMWGVHLDPEIVEALVALVSHTEQAVSIFDESDTLRYANEAFRTIMGLEPDEYPTWAELMRLSYSRKKGTRIDAEDMEAWLSSARGRRGKQSFRFNEADLYDGRWFYVGETTLPNGWMLCVFSDITSLATGQRKLRYERDIARRASLTDELTGLSNRRSMFQRFNELAKLSPDIPVVVVMLDIDFFKAVNDQFGHDAGDTVLRHFSSLLQQQTRRNDLAGRIGGEEFLLVLPNAQIDSAAALLERLYAILATASPLAANPEFRYSFSAGIAAANVGEGAQALLRHADEALYEAKSNGRNHYRIHKSDLSSQQDADGRRFHESPTDWRLLQ